MNGFKMREYKSKRNKIVRSDLIKIYVIVSFVNAQQCGCHSGISFSCEYWFSFSSKLSKGRKKRWNRITRPTRWRSNRSLKNIRHGSHLIIFANFTSYLIPVSGGTRKGKEERVPLMQGHHILHRMWSFYERSRCNEDLCSPVGRKEEGKRCWRS